MLAVSVPPAPDCPTKPNVSAVWALGKETTPRKTSAGSRKTFALSGLAVGRKTGSQPDNRYDYKVARLGKGSRNLFPGRRSTRKQFSKKGSWNLFRNAVIQCRVS